MLSVPNDIIYLILPYIPILPDSKYDFIKLHCNDTIRNEIYRTVSRGTSNIASKQNVVGSRKNCDLFGFIATEFKIVEMSDRTHQ